MKHRAAKKPHFIKDREAIAKPLQEKYGREFVRLQAFIQAFGVRIYYDIVTPEEMGAVANGLLSDIRANLGDLNRDLYHDILKFWSTTELRHRQEPEIIKAGGPLAMLESRTNAAKDFLVKKYGYELLTYIFKVASTEGVVLPVGMSRPKPN